MAYTELAPAGLLLFGSVDFRGAAATQLVPAGGMSLLTRDGCEHRSSSSTRSTHPFEPWTLVAAPSTPKQQRSVSTDNGKAGSEACEPLATAAARLSYWIDPPSSRRRLCGRAAEPAREPLRTGLAQTLLALPVRKEAKRVEVVVVHGSPLCSLMFD
jgi:hypothetical protein